MTERMSDWSGLTKAEARAIAREMAIAIAEVSSAIEHGKTPPLGALPGDKWLDVRLRERGCPEDQLEMWRERICSTPLRDVADG
jgi:hypothetical protein